MSTLRTSLFASRLLLLALILLFPILWLFFTDHGSAQIAPIKSSISEWTASTGFLSSSGGDRYSDGRASGGVYREVGGETKFVKGVAGATMWENIYLRNGTFLIISSDPASLPDPGWVMRDTPPEGRQHGPAGEDRWRVIRPEEAEEVLGRVAIKKGGASIFFNDSPGRDVGSFLSHYFHFAEVFLSAWRVITSSYGIRELPARIIFRTPPADWRDPAGLTSWFQQTVLPNTIIEDGPMWDDRAASGITYVFDKLAIIDRFASHNAGGKNIGLWNKMTMDLVDLPVPQDWMNPLRTSMKRFVASQGCELSRKAKNVPIVTYINRQRTGRRLNDHDSDVLDRELNRLAERGEVELYNQFFEDIPRPAQFCLALKSDVMIGVHGNGLTHQMWMAPGSAVLEFMMPTGFAMDYAFVARLMGHEYNAIHNDTTLPESEWITADGTPMYQGDGFHSNNIPVYGPFVAQLVEKLAAAHRKRH